MADNKAKALKEANKAHIKVELACYGAPEGNSPQTIDISDQLTWSAFPEHPLNFGGVCGYKVVSSLGDAADGVTADEVKVLLSEEALDKIMFKVQTLLKGAIVNAGQLTALQVMVEDIFHAEKDTAILQLNSILESPRPPKVPSHENMV